MPAYCLMLWRTSRFDYREVGVAKRGRSGRRGKGRGRTMKIVNKMFKKLNELVKVEVEF